MVVWLLLSCQSEENTSFWNHIPEPSAEPSSEDSASDPVDSADPLEDFTEGDPIIFLGSEPEAGEHVMGPAPEWITAALIDESTAVMAGQGSVGTIDIQTGAVLDLFNAPRGVHVDASDGVAVVSTRTDQIMLYDVSDVSSIVPSITIPGSDIPHEGIAIEGDRIFVGWRSEGLKIFNLEGQIVSTVDVNDASVVDVMNNRAALVDGSRLLLLDISNTTSVNILAEADLTGAAYDVVIDEQHIAVAVGSRGVELFEYEASAMQRRGQWTFSGASQGVALDGDYLWTANWSNTALMYIGGDTPVVLGEETPINSAFGVAAHNGRAVVADWYFSAAYQIVEGVASAEANLPKELHFQQDIQSHQWFRIVNGATRTLEITLDEPVGGYILNSAGTYSIPGGESISLSVATPNSTNWGDGRISWTSNDPDELTGEISLRPSMDGMGSSHPDFELPQLSYPDGLTGNVRLSDFLGKVVFISWWADY